MFFCATPNSRLMQPVEWSRIQTSGCFHGGFAWAIPLPRNPLPVFLQWSDFSAGFILSSAWRCSWMPCRCLGNRAFRCASPSGGPESQSTFHFFENMPMQLGLVIACDGRDGFPKKGDVDS